MSFFFDQLSQIVKFTINRIDEVNAKPYPPNLKGVNLQNEKAYRQGYLDGLKAVNKVVNKVVDKTLHG